MSVWSLLGSTIGAIVNVAVQAVEEVIDVAKQAIIWIADQGPVVWEGIEKVWSYTKRIIKPVLIFGAKYAPIPILRTIAKILFIIIEVLERVLDQQTMDKVRKAFEWCIDAAKKIKGYLLNEAERREAQQRGVVLQQAAENPAISDEQRRAIVIARIVNEYVLLQNEINDYLADKRSFVDYDHYLRVRAAHKLLDLTEQKLSDQDSELFDFSDDDMFILYISNNLICDNSRASDEELERLDRIIWEISGKKLLPFVFEELLLAWTKVVEEGEREWAVVNGTLAEMTVKLRTAENVVLFGGKTDIVIEPLRKQVDKEKANLDALSNINNYRWLLVNAAEGFLQILEGNANVADTPYLLNKGDQIGRLIIECQEMGRDFNDLTDREKALLVDFSNIFKKDRENRISNIPTIEVEVGV
ncbi:hypothetical protein MASR1M36_09060 [Candidatus Cloacimonadaceae bacterium]